MTELSWKDKIPQPEHRLIYRLLKAGVHVSLMAKVCRVTEKDIEDLWDYRASRRVDRVLRYLKWREERSLPEPPRKPPKHQKVPTEDHWSVYRRRKAGETYGSIAKTYGCSKTTIDHIVAKQFRWQKIRVWKYLERRAMRPKPKKAPAPKAPTKDIGYRFIPKLQAGDAHKMLMLYKKVKNYAEVGRAFGVSHSTASKVIRRAEKSQASMVWFYLQKRQRRMYAWNAKMQSMEFEMNRGEG